MVDHSDVMMTATAAGAAPATAGLEDESGVRQRAERPALVFEEVYAQHFDFVWRTARRLGVGDLHVDDVVQDVFVVVHRKLAGFEGRSSLKTWLYAITRRVVSDHRRAQKRRRPHTPISDSLACCGASPQERAARLEAAQLLHAFLDTLPDEQREVFVLAELEQMTAPETVEATGAKLNTVYSRLRLARAAFERFVARHRARRAAIRRRATW